MIERDDFGIVLKHPERTCKQCIRYPCFEGIKRCCCDFARYGCFSFKKRNNDSSCSTISKGN